MNFVLPLVAILAVVVAVVAVALASYNFFRMLQEIRPQANWWANLIPYIALALPGALTPEGENYRARAGRWMLLTVVCAAAAAGAQYLGDR